MHNKVQDHGEFFKKKVCSDASEEPAASLFGGTEFGYCCFWNDWEKGMCPLCSSTGYNRAGITQSV